MSYEYPKETMNDECNLLCHPGKMTKAFYPGSVQLDQGVIFQRDQMIQIPDPDSAFGLVRSGMTWLGVLTVCEENEYDEMRTYSTPSGLLRMGSTYILLLNPVGILLTKA
jgi:hypothetical protein